MAEVCFKGGYIDAWGRGTLKIIDACRDAELPAPEIVERDGGFSVTLFLNKYSDSSLENLGLNDRQVKAVRFVLQNGSISNSEFLTLNKVSESTALRDLADIVSRGIFQKKGAKKTARYFLHG